MWELDCEESWGPKNWCFWTVVLEKTLESLLDCKEIKLVNLKRNQPWIFTGRTDAEAPILWPPDLKSLLIGKDPDAGKDWRQEEKGVTEDEMVGWHHWLNGHEFEQTLGDTEGQGNLLCCSLWGATESDASERLNNSFLICLHFCCTNALHLRTDLLKKKKKIYWTCLHACLSLHTTSTLIMSLFCLQAQSWLSME